MQILPEEDPLEIGQLHPVVDLLKLGAGLIELELVEPGLFAKGR
tara:strand:- start:3185 stop:3316 length:132 start_codon:yes stop_codon:yes gene_type:complete